MKADSEHRAHITVHLPLGVWGTCGSAWTGSQNTLYLAAKSDKSQEEAKALLAEAVERILTAAGSR